MGGYVIREISPGRWVAMLEGDARWKRACLHCNENPFDVFPEKELCGLSPNFHIHVSVSDLYIPRIGLHISSSRIGRPSWEYINCSQTQECGNWD
jgi:hypothetical protein